MVLSSDIRFIVFSTLNVLGNVMYSLIVLVRKEANLYAGAFFQFIIGLMVVGVLCSFMRFY
jgi:hypothetical protein